ncbi:MAG: hypothetical protein ACTH30_12960 [Leucobacter sp.]
MNAQTHSRQVQTYLRSLGEALGGLGAPEILASQHRAELDPASV